MKENCIKTCGLFLFTLFVFPLSFASVPQKMNYQAVVRNSNDELVRDQHIGMRISILHQTNDGIAVYVETQTPQTNNNGLVSLEIGDGNAVIGTFSEINWADGPYFIKTEIDISGGTSYNIKSVQQLLSVPYAQHAATAIAAQNMIPGTMPGEMLYWDGNNWVDIPPGLNGTILTLVDGVPQWKLLNEISDADAEPDPDPDPNLDLDPISVYNPETGKYWMDRNLGASQVATSSTDALAYGYLYQWGRGTDGHEKRTSRTTNTLSSNDSPGHGSFILSPSSPYDWRNPQNGHLWQGVNGINNPCPAGYRIPTEVEWDAERLSWGSSNSAGAFASPLKLSVAGYRNFSDGSLYNVGSYGNYWSSTINGCLTRNLYFYSSFASKYFGNRADGYSVRCIKD